MKVGDLVRMQKRTYCILWYTNDYVALQSVDEDRLLTTVPRTKLGGLRKGS